MGARIALVEDEIDIAKLIQHTLESHGYEVDHYEDGLAALEATRRDPDLWQG
ncbi:MAG: hypothetical protein QHI38_04560 [Armatimonadota bacterium]|nr:hypothetical protein [Armatimonadota bacterium]